MIRASRRPVAFSHAPASRRRLRQLALGDQLAHAAREAAQAHLGVGQRPGGVAARGHARLHALDQHLVLDAHAAVDAQVEVARRAHLAPRVRMHVGDLADQGLGRRQRHELHEVDLVRVDVERHVGPELEVRPQALALRRQLRHRRQELLVGALGPVGRGRVAQRAPHLVDPRARLDAVALAEQAREARVRHVDVQPVGEVVGDVLPVHPPRPQRHAPHGHAAPRSGSGFISCR